MSDSLLDVGQRGCARGPSVSRLWRALRGARRRDLAASIAAILSFAAAASCSVTVDLDPLQDGVSCPSGQKSCYGSCVSIMDPDYGCTPDRCAPCTLMQADAVCDPSSAEGQCVLSRCIPGTEYESCDGDLRNGCETNTNTSLDHCGFCNTPCTCEVGFPTCIRGSCRCSS
ncbi:hypothetical protein [Sorangium sp. So ce406]|uniref:hypothetical protein n=1 Tax=Sorangium sp. So ce406 TaxID=3133311 RepID=UPI003F5BC4FF